MKEEKDKRRSFLKHILAGSAVVVSTATVIKSSRVKTAAGKQRPEEVLYTETGEFCQYYKSLRS